MRVFCLKIMLHLFFRNHIVGTLDETYLSATINQPADKSAIRSISIETALFKL